MKRRSGAAFSQRPRVLITAGPTREYLDPVRYLSNDSSGRMGCALAEAAAKRGWAVTVVHGPVALTEACWRLRSAGVSMIPVVSAADMLGACRELWPRHDVLIMAAAVADYTPVRSALTKRKKGASEITLRLKATVDILATLAGGRRPGQVVVGFALEDRRGRERAERKLRRKGLDVIVLNRLEAIGAERSAVEVLVRGGRWRALPRAAKERQAGAIVGVVEEVWSEVGRGQAP